MLLITNKETTEINTHRITPWTTGFTPTLFSVSRDNPAPIRNNVSVNPILDPFTRPSYTGLKCGKKVTIKDAPIKPKIK